MQTQKANYVNARSEGRRECSDAVSTVPPHAALLLLLNHVLSSTANRPIVGLIVNMDEGSLHPRKASQFIL